MLWPLLRLVVDFDSKPDGVVGMDASEALRLEIFDIACIIAGSDRRRVEDGPPSEVTFEFAFTESLARRLEF